ncbi:MAG: hypothetical protein AB1898_23645 [Acidobacteriota bacterium]
MGILVHEIGNSLGWQTYMNDPYNAYEVRNKENGIADPDVGAAFENCVFGGIVDVRTGLVGTERNF